MLLVLLVDDDKEMLEYTSEYLQAKGLETHCCSRAQLVLPFLDNNPADICVLDVNMPVINGFELAEQIKQKHPELPFLFLSGQTAKEHRISGLKIGADDYIIKPFSLEELFLRIQIILNRKSRNREENTNHSRVFYLGKIAFDSDYRLLNFLENSIRLSSIENQILTILCKHGNECVSRSELMNHVWGDTDIYKSRSLNVYINKLRKYLETEPDIEIVNEHGKGYKLVFK